MAILIMRSVNIAKEEKSKIKDKESGKTEADSLDDIIEKYSLRSKKKADDEEKKKTEAEPRH